MQREPTLADILADDTGNLRPEVADYLMGGRPPRARPRPPRAQAQRNQTLPLTPRSPYANWVLLAMALLVLTNIIATLSAKDEKETPQIQYPSCFEDLYKTKKPSSLTQGNPTTLPHPDVTSNQGLPDNASSKNSQANSTGTSSVPNNSNKAQQSSRAEPNIIERVPAVRQQETTSIILGRGKVFGFSVNIREYPNLKAAIIRKTDQGEVFSVLSFAHGWYQVLLGSNQAAYIFGAYLLPIDFTNNAHWIGINKDGKKLLLTSCSDEHLYQVILPNHKTYYMRKSHVRIVR